MSAPNVVRLLAGLLVYVLIEGVGNGADQSNASRDQGRILRFLNTASVDYRARRLEFRRFIGAEQRPHRVGLLIQALKFEETSHDACELLAELGGEAETAVPHLIRAMNHDFCSVECPVMALAAIGKRLDIALPELVKGARGSWSGVSTIGTYYLALGMLGPKASAAEKLVAEQTHGIKWHPAKWTLWRIAPRRYPNPIPGWIRELKGKKKERKSAAAMLQWTQPDVKRLPALTRYLADPDISVRNAIIVTVSRMRRQAVPAIVKLLHHKSAGVRVGAIQAIGKMSGRADAAVPNLLDRMRNDPSPAVRSAAIEALDGIGVETATMLQPLIAALGDKSQSVREAACDSLAIYSKNAAPAIPSLIALLKRSKESSNLWYLATDALVAIGQPAAASLQLLLKEKNNADRFRAAFVLAQIQAAPDDEVVQILALKLNGDSSGFLSHELMLRLGHRAKASVPILIRLLRSRYDDLKMGSVTGAYCALEILGRIGPAAKTAVPILIRVLKDKSLSVHTRDSAAVALGNIGPAAKAAVPALIAALRDKQVEKTDGLRIIFSGTSLYDKTVTLRSEAALALGRIGDKRALPHLRRALGDDGRFTRSLTTGSAIYLRVFHAVRVEAVHGLSRFPVKSIQPVLADLEKKFDEQLKKDKDDRLATADLYLATAVARFIPNRRRDAVRLILEHLKTGDVPIRSLAAELLGRIGPPAAAAIPQLTIAARDFRMYVRTRAIAALKAIRKPGKGLRKPE